MAFDPKRAQKWFAGAALAIIAIVLGFYGYARMHFNRSIKGLERKLDVKIEQSAQGFTLTKSEQGRTLFLVHATSVEQFTGGQAALHGVNIVIYNQDGSGADQIYGDDFLYDSNSGEVRADGVVHMDLQGASDVALAPGQLPKELKNPLHLKTSALVFNQKTGIAQTEKLIEFRAPQAAGTAEGANYDSHTQMLTLHHDVRIRLTGENPTDVFAARATLQQQPRQAVLQEVSMQRKTDSLTSGRLVLDFATNNNVSGGRAEGGVRITQGPARLLAPRLDFTTNDNGELRSATMTGGVQMQGLNGQHGQSDRMVLTFDAKGAGDTLHAVGHVRLSQPGTGARPQDTDLIAEALDVHYSDTGLMQSANTVGEAHIELTEKQLQRTTQIMADKFTAAFDAKGALSSISGTPNAHSVTHTQGQPDATSSSQTATARFGPEGITLITESGGFRYTQGTRSANAEMATYNATSQVSRLTGSPRIVDQNLTTTARVMTLNQITGEATGEGDVKSTWLSNGRSGADGMFRSGEVTHATAQSMVANRADNIARYLGAARLWQGTSIVEAPLIEFHSDTRSILARGEGTSSVRTSFLQLGRTGTGTPVNVTSTMLEYDDSKRKARFDGGVLLRTAQRTIRADLADVYLTPAPAKTDPSSTPAPTRLDRIEATGHVHLEEPGRYGDGHELVYTEADQKSVLTGTAVSPPSIFDAEHGKITGDSLTFYNVGDRVLVSSSNSRATTSTHVNTAPKQ